MRRHILGEESSELCPLIVDFFAGFAGSYRTTWTRTDLKGRWGRVQVNVVSWILYGRKCLTIIFCSMGEKHRDRFPTVTYLDSQRMLVFHISLSLPFDPSTSEAGTYGFFFGGNFAGRSDKVVDKQRHRPRLSREGAIMS